MSTGRLAGKVALISGGARGQGASEAKLFVKEGAKVVIGDILDDEGKAVAEELGPDAAYVHLDVTSEASWGDAVKATEEQFGHITVLVNNAGILTFGALADTKLEDFQRIFAVNVNGVFLGMKTVAPSMEAAGGGSIVNISSTSGLVGLPFVGVYGASKWAVRGMTKSAAMEMGSKRIRVNSVHPGGIDTPMIGGTGDDSAYYRRLPVPRLGSPDEVARAVLFLASDESSYIAGAELAVDGGATAGDYGIFDD